MENKKSKTSVPVEFDSPTACGEWLCGELLSSLQQVGLTPDSRAEAALTDSETKNGIDGIDGCVEASVRGVVSVFQQCKKGDRLGPAAIIPFEASAKLRYINNQWVVYTAELFSNDDSLSSFDL